MARIRSVHPGQWTDEDFVNCSPTARLLVIGIRNEADDQGVFEWKPNTLKMRLLPLDNVNLTDLLEELLASRQIMRFEVNGKSYGAIRNFRKYQRPEKPKAVHPIIDIVKEFVGLSDTIQQPVNDSSPTAPQKSPQRKEEGGRRERKDEGDKESDANASLVGEAVELWNETAGKLNLSKVQAVTGQRKSALLARMRSCGGIEGWKSALEKLQKIPWMHDGTARGGWTASFDFLVQESKFTKLMEGNYDVRFDASPTTPKLTDHERAIFSAR